MFRPTLEVGGPLASSLAKISAVSYTREATENKFHVRATLLGDFWQIDVWKRNRYKIFNANRSLGDIL